MYGSGEKPAVFDRPKTLTKPMLASLAAYSSTMRSMPKRPVKSSQISGAESVADGEPHAVCAIGRLRRLRKEIPAQLADVAEGGGVVLDEFVEEPRRRELLADRQARTGGEHRRQRDRECVVVIEGQRRVHHVVTAKADTEAADAVHRHQPAVVTQLAGLGISGGTGGEDQDRGRSDLDGLGGLRIDRRARSDQRRQLLEGEFLCRTGTLRHRVEGLDQILLVENDLGVDQTELCSSTAPR